MRAAPSSHKSSSSPGLDHLLGNFLVLPTVSAAEWLWSLRQNNGEAQRSEISGNTADNCPLKCSQTAHRSHRSSDQNFLRHFKCNPGFFLESRALYWSSKCCSNISGCCGSVDSYTADDTEEVHLRRTPAWLRMGIVQASGWRSVTSLQYSCVEAQFLLCLL